METVNDGQFHSVELVMLNQTLNLVVDKGAPKSLGKLQKQSSVSLNTPLYIGGTASCSGLCGFNRSSQKEILFHPMERTLWGGGNSPFAFPLCHCPAERACKPQLWNWLAPRCRGGRIRWKYHKQSQQKSKSIVSRLKYTINEQYFCWKFYRGLKICVKKERLKPPNHIS